jgi:hypothetical protein
MTDNHTWLEFECPVCGMDQDIEPPPAIGATWRASCCGRTFVISAENAQLYERDAAGVIHFRPPHA